MKRTKAASSIDWRVIFAVVLFAALSFVAAPVQAQQPSSVNPTAQSVKEEQLLNALKPGDKVSGRVSIPDPKAANLIQPEGRDWRAFHNGPLRWVSAVAILGMIATVAIYYFTRGAMRTPRDPAGRTITRFNAFERFVHWLTATCFIILALSGLNVTFGKLIVLPLLGENAFGAFSAWAKLAHNYLAFPFMLGIVLTLAIWIKDNIPGAVDVAWLKAGGGVFNDSHPPAPRFNAGQKLIFWSVILGGAALSWSGWNMLFPYQVADGVTGLQFWTLVHGIVAGLMIAVMVAHIYIGTIGMEGAFDAMGSGEVDLNWAKAHHSLWVEEELQKDKVPAGGMMPAE